MDKAIMLFPVLLPIICGILMFCLNKRITKNGRRAFVTAALLAEAVLTALMIYFGKGELILWQFTEKFAISLKLDMTGALYLFILSFMWLVTGIYSFEYMDEEDCEENEYLKTKTLSANTFYGFYLLTLGVMTGAGFASNLITFYLFYEFMTLLSMPFVLHTMTNEALFAAKKYLFYSIAGASLALFCFAVLYSVTGGNLYFSEGGILASLPEGKETITLIAVFLGILGFGTKAGMFPMHSWLPSAHPVAPAPASAVLSGVITKTGVLGIIRIVYYIVGADILRGTWVQYTFMTLALITVFMGSMLAYKEMLLKKRLAYSTVSQVSYILFGISLLNPIALLGAFLHMVFHSVLKCGLFMNAGSVIHKTGRTRVEELSGLGRKMPATFGSFVIFALGLVGIPPVCGFISKWYLCIGAMYAGIPCASYLGPVILLVSALLTAGYLVTIFINAYFEKGMESTKEIKEPEMTMLIPMVMLAVIAVVLGLIPNGIISSLEGYINTLF